MHTKVHLLPLVFACCCPAVVVSCKTDDSGQGAIESSSATNTQPSAPETTESYDGLRAPVAMNRLRSCESEAAPRAPTAEKTKAPTQELGTGVAAPIVRDSTETLAEKARITAKSPPKAPDESVAYKASARAASLGAADREYLDELARRSAELSLLEPSAREKLAAEMKSRHLNK